VVERRWRRTNVELVAGGGGEVWLDGPVRDWFERSGGLGSWVGVVVDDVDAVHARLNAAGHEVPEPRTRPFGVRELSVTDPEGHRWGFVQRLPSPAEDRPSVPA
jgi:MerR family transcriptional regulator, thiopeptide resistance regulator